MVKQILLNLGLEGRPTLEKCQRIKLKKEAENEMLELQDNIIIENRLRKESKGETVVGLKRLISGNTKLLQNKIALLADAED